MPTEFVHYDLGDTIGPDDLNAVRDAINALEEGGTPMGFTALNDSGSTIQAGRPVKLMSDGSVALAQANDIANEAIGMMAETTADGLTGVVLRVGILELPDWTAVVGTTSLVPQTEYFLAASVLGKLIDSAPSVAPDIQQYMAVALTAQKMFVLPERALKFN